MDLVDLFRVVVREMRGDLWQHDAWKFRVVHPLLFESESHATTGVRIGIVDGAIHLVVSAVILHPAMSVQIKIVIDKLGIERGVVAQQVHVARTFVDKCPEFLGKLLSADLTNRERCQEARVIVPKLRLATRFELLARDRLHVPPQLEENVPSRIARTNTDGDDAMLLRAVTAGLNIKRNDCDFPLHFVFYFTIQIGPWP